MSFEYWFEADKKLDKEKMKDLFLEAGAKIVSDPNKEIQVFYFSESGLNAWECEVKDGQDIIKSEDAKGLVFSVGSRCIFRVDSHNYNKKLNDLERFLNKVYETTGAHFVVSFQLEKACYLNPTA